MTKRIFQSICIAVFSVFFASAILFMGVLYEYFSRIQHDQLDMQTSLAAQGVTNGGMEYFQGLDVKDYRMTWIAEDGTVLYDSRSDSVGMENHLEREEIRQAFSEGMGESSRYSVTLLERSLYCAQRLPDGTVLRLSVAQNTLLTLLLGMFQPICIIFTIAMGLSLVLAFRLSRGIVKPLNELNLDEPLDNKGYDELAPLLQRIAAQQRQIRRQRDELRQRQSEFETVTTGMAEGIVLLNEKKIILSMNSSAARLFGTDDSCVG
ncbi:MAG: PAS domain-containing sensor histidine kinase, partial [Acetatifactor sp.]|nr:PAS domain-containing sensor histidine kinase [Acetatifactor sp.]